jgi:hypothetical protein
MNHYAIPLAKQDLLHDMLQIGGKATVHLHSPAQVIQAEFDVELTDTHARCSVELGGHTGQVTLRRADRANHLHLRDFIEDIANGPTASPVLAPAPATPAVPVPSRELCAADESTLRYICRHGGSRTLACEALVSVHIAGTYHALLSLTATTEHLTAETNDQLYADLATRIEQLLEHA